MALLLLDPLPLTWGLLGGGEGGGLGGGEGTGKVSPREAAWTQSLTSAMDSVGWR